MTEYEAYRRFNREQRLRQQWLRKLRLLSLELEGIALDIADAISADGVKIASSLRDNPRYAKTVEAFMRYRGYSKNMAGWRLACGTDIGLYKRTRKLGWERLWRILLMANRKRCT